jgi:hypothetical protein
MKNEKRFVPLSERFNEWVRGMPKRERAKLKGFLKRLDGVIKVASQLLFWAKFAPEVERDSRIHAKWVAHDLKTYKHIILRAAERQDKRFFIDLGKFLSGNLDSTIYDKMDEYVAVIVAFNPSITAKGGVRVLEALGLVITEDNFRERKYRLLRAAAKFGVQLTVQKQPSRRKAHAAEDSVKVLSHPVFIRMLKGPTARA